MNDLRQALNSRRIASIKKGVIDKAIFYSDASSTKSVYNSGEPVIIFNPAYLNSKGSNDDDYRKLPDDEEFKAHILGRLNLGYKYK